jgi:hypothetical protein
MTHPWFRNQGPGSLPAATNALYSKKYAENSIKTLTTKMKKFIVFANIYGILQYTDDTWRIPALDPVLMAYYATYLLRDTQINKIKSLRTYISAVSSWCTTHGRPNPTWDPTTGKPHHFFTGVLKAISKEMGDAPTDRMPITAFHMEILYDNANSFLPQAKTITYHAMITLAWYGLLRVSEFTNQGGQAVVPALRFKRGDIKFFPSLNDPQYYTVFIKQSKTDQNRVGHLLKIFANGTKTCPVRAMQKLFVTFPQPTTAAMFQLDGSATRTKFVNITKTLLLISDINTTMLKSHSFRQGGASAALQVAPAWQVKLLGRWKSDSWRLYAFLDNQIIQQTHNAMGNVPLIPGSATGRVIHQDFDDV